MSTAAMRAGAQGCALKGANPQELLSVIRAVAEGQALFGPAIAVRMARFFQEAAGSARASASPQSGAAAKNRSSEGMAGSEGFSDLTDWERGVLEPTAGGYNNTVITQKLVISPKKVRNHITNIFSKLQVADRAQAICRARTVGYG